MNCHDAREWLSGWVDETLTAEEHAALAAHLGQCAECRHELGRFRETVALLRRVERPRAPAGFAERALGAARPTSWHRKLFDRLFLPLAVKLPAEAAALLLVAGLAAYVFQRTPELQQAARPDVSGPAVPAEAPRAAAPPVVAVPREPHASRDTESSVKVRPEPQPELRGKVANDARGAKLGVSDEMAKTAAPPASATAMVPGPPPPADATLEAGKEATAEGTLVPRASEPAPSQGRLAAPASPPAIASGPPSAPDAKLEARKGAAPEGTAVSRAPEPAPAPPPGRREPGVGARSDTGGERALAAPAPSTALSRAAMRALPPDVSGRLTVKDRAAAESALVDLLARSGGTLVSRHPESGVTVIDLVVPRAGYAELMKGLPRIGAWLPEREPSGLPAEVRVTLRLSE